MAVNSFQTDTEEEHKFIISKVKEFGAEAVLVNHWQKGGLGAIDLAEKVISAAKQGSNNFK